jgi:hypothetical protein
MTDEHGSAAGSRFRLSYAVDIVFAIDVTASMAPFLEDAKLAALSFYDDLNTKMKLLGKEVSQVRARVVAYRDFLHQPLDALQETKFFLLPQERSAFDAEIKDLEPIGGDDEPESGLEALVVAMRSEWERRLDRRRHVIVVVTDAPAHQLEVAAQSAPAGYPEDMPRSFAELTDLWEERQRGPMEWSAKRLLLYAPEVEPWTTISELWTNALHFTSNAGDGLDEVVFDEILDQIGRSV